MATRLTVRAAVWLFLATAGFSSADPMPLPEGFLGSELKPFLKKYCSECHGGAEAESGISFDEVPPASEFVKSRSKHQ